MVKIFNGQRLRQARLYNGLSINDLAEILGVTKQAISQYETQNVTPEFEKMRILTEKLKFPSSYYPVCPRCGISLDREYQSFCDRCGQRLDWKHYKEAQIIYPDRI